MIWPLELEALREFVSVLDEVLVLEESRLFLEPQADDIICSLPSRVSVLGKRNSDGARWLPSHGERIPAMIARVRHRRLEPLQPTDAMDI